MNPRFATVADVLPTIQPFLKQLPPPRWPYFSDVNWVMFSILLPSFVISEVNCGVPSTRHVSNYALYKRFAYFSRTSQPLPIVETLLLFAQPHHFNGTEKNEPKVSSILWHIQYPSLILQQGPKRFLSLGLWPVLSCYLTQNSSWFCRTAPSPSTQQSAGDSDSDFPSEVISSAYAFIFYHQTYDSNHSYSMASKSRPVPGSPDFAELDAVTISYVFRSLVYCVLFTVPPPPPP